VIATVWAPLARAVALDVDGSVTPMLPTDGGWWAGGTLAPGDRYGFRLDDDPTVLPDPRSRFQPDGVHAPSEVVDLADFAWTDHSWTGRQLAGSVLYELHVGTFTADGTLDAAIERLAHLVELGIDAVELLPVNAFDGTRNWGYDGVLWFAVDDSYGGPRAYQRFVDACHRLGLAVIQDVVYNHLGPSGNYLPRFGPYLRTGTRNTWGDSVKLDEHEVRRFIVDNAVMWCRDLHVDGLRLDAVHALHDESPTHILRELSDEIDALSAAERRPLTLIAESDLNDPAMVTPREAGGLGIHAQWSDDFHHAAHVAVTGETSGYYADFERLDALAKVLQRGFFHDGTWSSFRDRDHGVPIDTSAFAAWRLVVAAQNHDQIGNRAAGDRLAATLSPDRLAIAAMLTLSSPFTPMLFMGEEWAASTPWQFFTAFGPELADATRTGRIAEFARMGWDRSVVPDPQDPATFERSTLRWDELAEPAHASLLQVHRDLIALRRTTPDLTDPRLDRRSVEVDADARSITFRCGRTLVAANLGEREASIGLAAGDMAIRFATDHERVRIDAGRLVLVPDSGAVVSVGAGSSPTHGSGTTRS
jgi:maltooligosyltrehalose trehalohydrolase